MLPVLFILFVGSGCAALIYEVVWFQLLELVIGSSSVSIGVLLGTFMGGMCLGSLALPRIVSPRHHPLRVYAALEAVIGVSGMLLLLIMPSIGRLYTAWGGEGATAFLLRGTVAAVCLLLPTLAMGATLPAVARWVETTPAGVSWLGFFYAGNIAGAVCGSLLAGFYLLRVYDMAIATYAAAAMNAAVAVLAVVLASSNDRRPTGDGHATKGGAYPEPEARRPATDATPKPEARSLKPVYLAIALSGFCALAGEVIWTRQLALLFGATVYTFSLILAVFLTGLGIGSVTGSVLSKAINPRIGFGWCQVLIVAAIAWTAHELGVSLPYWPINPTISANIWLNFKLDLVRALWAMLPPAILWGASFPLALAAVSARGRDAGRLVGGVYAANTIGAVVGALTASLLLVAWIGSQRTQQIMMIVSALAGLLVLVTIRLGARPINACTGSYRRAALRAPRKNIGNSAGEAGLLGACSDYADTLLEPDTTYPTDAKVRLKADTTYPTYPTYVVSGASRTGAYRAIAAWGPLVGAALLTVFMVRSVPPVPGMLVAHGRFAATLLGQAGDIIYVGEGLQSSVAVSRLPTGKLGYHNAGKIQASSAPEDMRLQRMLGHLTTLVPRNPSSVLVIGCGAGVTAGAVSINPLVERVTIAEIEPLVPRVVSTYFSAQNYDVVRNPKVHIHIDDARHYLLTTTEKFDAITSDPLDPWVKGAATLYTREFFEAARDHLNPGGVVTLFVQLYDSSPDAVKSEIATFFEVFPNGLIAGNTFRGVGYDTVLLGQVEPMRIDLDEIEARLARSDFGPVAASLREIGLASAVDLFSTYAGRAVDLKAWLRDASINTDRNLRLQYLAGLGLNMNESDAVYAEILKYRRFPEDVFTGSDTLVNLLKKRIPSP